jgi:hypothetical protein
MPIIIPRRWANKFRRGLLLIGIGLVVLISIVIWEAYPYFLSFSAQFRRSKPALEAYATKVMANGPAALASPPSKLGYFHVLKMESLPNGFLFQSDYGNPFDWDGIAYSTTPLPEYDNDGSGQTKQIFTPIEGNWYEVFRP